MSEWAYVVRQAGWCTVEPGVDVEPVIGSADTVKACAATELARLGIERISMDNILFIMTPGVVG